MAHKLQSPVAGCYFVSCLMLMHFAEFGATKTSAAEDNQLPAAWTRLKRLRRVHAAGG